MRDLVSLKRIVQKTGVSTLTVSLPKSWTERTGVSKGSELFALEQPDGSLVLSQKHEEEKRESVDLAIDPLSSKDDLIRRFYAAYLAGFDSIRIHSGSKISSSMREAVFEETRRLIGVEIVEETPNSIVIKDFFSREGLDIQKSLKRMHLITCGLFEDLLEEKDVGSILERDDEVDRLRFLLARQLNLALKNPAVLNSLELTSTKCVDYAIVTLFIERIADRVTEMAEMVSKEKREVFKPVRPELQKAYDIYCDSVKSFIHKDFGLALKVINSRKTFSDELNDLNKKLWQKSIGYTYLIEYTNSIVDASVSIAEQAINQS